MATSVFARGRGRGRGISSRGQLRRPGDSVDGANSNGVDEKEVVDIGSLTKAINKLRFEPSDEGFERVTKLAKGFGTSDEKLKQIVDLLSQKSKEDSDFAVTGIGIAKRICKDDDIGPKFRSFLLKAAQEDYKSREEIKKNALSRWIGVVCFISEIFKVLRVNEAPLKPLASPIYSMISELLSGEENEEEIDCFNLVFREIGELLESVDKANMDKLLREIRDKIVKPQTSARTRCMLLEMMELKSSNWVMSKEVEQYYADTLLDIMTQEP